MVFTGGTSGSLQPWYRMSLPPCEKNAFMSGFVAFMIRFSGWSPFTTSLSKSNVFQSQFGSLNTT